MTTDQRRTRQILPILLVASLALLISIPAVAGTTSELLAGKYTDIEQVQVDQDAQGFVVAGELARKHFSPRRMLRGAVEATVLGPDGSILAQATLATRPAFVPKGLRTAAFSGRIDGSFPAGSRLVLKPTR